MTPPADIRYAGVVSRGVAFVVDAVVVVTLAGVTVTIVAMVGVALGVEVRRVADGLATVATVAPPVLLALYLWLFSALAGRSVGQALLGLRVVRTDGRAVSWVAALVRSLVLVVLPVGVLWSVVDARHQGLHDKAAGTVVRYDA